MVPPPLSLPGPAELTAHAIADRVGLAGRVRVEQLGRSRAGRPIELLSVGEGPRSALIVGAPHPNEPTGCLTVLRLLARLAAAPEHTPGWRWHVIPAIDIDGIALNQHWLGRSPDLEAYLANFYRPPFRLQPEYGFPLALPHYSFNSETPESACWRRALEMTRPDLQCSLHGADTGGAFFIVSRDHPGLSARLARLPESFGITLNEVGEPFAEMTVFRPGVFSFPSVTAMVGLQNDAGAETLWNAGDSSAGYASARFGTLSLTCEVPLWHDAREDDRGPSGRTLGETVDERIHRLREDAELLTTSLPALRPPTGTFQAQALIESLEDALSGAVGLMSALARARPRGALDRLLSVRELVWVEAGTYSLRTPAMVARLAALVGARSIQALARGVLDTRLTALRRSTRLSPVPLDRSTDLQMAAIDTAAGFLSDGGDTGDSPD